MAVCIFFGHRDCPASLRPRLHSAVVELIERHGVDTFYVGRQGAFDALARSVLRELEAVYPHISYAVVLERLPGPGDEAVRDFSHAIFPEGLEIAPPRFAVSRRNEWMLKRSDFVVTYITHGWGGAARFAEKARRQGKAVIPLAQVPDRSLPGEI